MFKSLLAALLTAAFFSIPTYLAAFDLNKLMSAVMPLQMIYDGKLKNICTATSMNQEQHYWLTAAHCVEIDPETGGVRFIGGDQTTFVKVDPELDLAIIKTERVSAPHVKLAKVGPTFGTPLTLVGYPKHVNQPIVTWGTVANPSVKWWQDYDRLYMLYTVVGAPGNSGSSVFNNLGEVVSVVQETPGLGRNFEPMMSGSTFEQLRASTIGYWGE